MCGIATFIDFSKTSQLTHLKSMCQTLSHRGPDASGFYFDNRDSYTIGISHARLSIIDLNENANQPMKFNQFIIVFNGEIYNYKEVKAELIIHGHKFITESDTEVILHAYDEWGVNCVSKFIGMFVFVIYDENKEEILIFRDRAGVKPVFYYWDNTSFLIASEIKAFHKYPLFKKEIDVSAIPDFFQYGYIPSSKSIFKNVNKLGGGSFLSFNLLLKTINITKYWNVRDYYLRPKLNISFEDAKEKTLELINSSCNYRMIADVPVGIFLSGGFDSSLTTSIIQSNRKNKIKTFTIGVHNQKLDEANYAKEIANFLGTDHTEMYCSENEMLPLLEQIPFYYDEPFGDSSAIPTMLVSKLAREQVKVAISADGGDELFAGYNRYDYLNKLKKIRILSKLPLPYKLFAHKFDGNSSDKYRLFQLLHNPSVFNLANLLNTAYSPKELDKFFNLETRQNKNTERRDDLPQPKDDLSQILSYDFVSYLVDDILTKVDRATMSASIEGREPLLDHRLIEFVAQLPNEYKYHNGIKKYILKEITYKYIPEKLLNRPKMGFGVPVFNWLTGVLGEKLDYYLGETFLNNQGLFNSKEISSLTKNVLSGKDRHFQKVWYLLIFQLWYETWILNEK